ncbi:MAG: M28 family peptidase [Clostridia bacterium]|nr:M28 family peptidase [Clostridia bacterium]
MDFLKELNDKFPIRKTQTQKDAFRRYVLGKAAEKEVDAKIEQNGKNKNVVIGNPLTAEVIFTAHYDTPNASLFPNLMMPINKGLFYAYQFLIIAVLLLVSITPAIVIGMGVLQSEIAYAGIFLALYFGLFLLGFKTFINKNNANDNTSGVATVLTIMKSLDKEKLSKVAFILFDNEEKGLLGSKAYKKDHKQEIKDKLLINFDCVGNGDNILLLAKPKAEENQNFTRLKTVFTSGDGFTVGFYSSKKSVANSDQKNFEQGVACVACKKSKRGILYTPYIHTAKDIVADDKNIEFITNKIIEFVNS